MNVMVAGVVSDMRGKNRGASIVGWGSERRGTGVGDEERGWGGGQ